MQKIILFYFLSLLITVPVLADRSDANEGDTNQRRHSRRDKDRHHHHHGGGAVGLQLGGLTLGVGGSGNGPIIGVGHSPDNGRSFSPVFVPGDRNCRGHECHKHRAHHRECHGHECHNQ